MISVSSEPPIGNNTTVIKQCTLLSPILTVIVLVYNCEKYVEECVKSLMLQTLGNIEYIFIDDASQDNSLRFLIKEVDKYPKRKSAITIIQHKYNRGVSYSRQEGINISHGKWIIFCDSDDIVNQDAYKKMINAGMENECDMVVCGISTFGDINKSAISVPGSGSMDANYMMEGICGMRRKSIHGSLCNKLIKYNFIKDVHLPENLSYCEDEIALFQVLLKSPKIFCIPKSFYKYRVHGSSLVRTKDNTMLQQVEILLKTISSIAEKGDYQFRKALNVKITIYLYRLLKSKRLDTGTISLRYGMYLPYLKDNNKLNYLEKLHLSETLKNHETRAILIGKINQLGYNLIKLLR